MLSCVSQYIFGSVLIKSIYSLLSSSVESQFFHGIKLNINIYNNTPQAHMSTPLKSVIGFILNISGGTYASVPPLNSIYSFDSEVKSKSIKTISNFFLL